MGYARKVDNNHADIVEALEKSGWFFHSTAGLPGFVDGIAAKQSRLELVEIKSRHGKLTPPQEKLHRAFQGAGVTVRILRSVDDAIRL